MNKIPTIVLATHENFDEEGYLELNTDVKDAVRNPDSRLSSGLDYFRITGFAEKRKQYNMKAIMKVKEKKLGIMSSIVDESLAYTKNMRHFDFLPAVERQYLDDSDIKVSN